MQERGVGKPWTAEEDRLLTQAVAVHGEVDNWKTVALSVPGRTNKACRKRWLHSLSPNVKKTAWTAEEDQLLRSLYAIHGTKWAVIARNIPGRTDDACSKRYREALDPSLKREEWTSEEDGQLLDAYARVGGKWGVIGQELNRSSLACRNRWRMMERKKTAGIRQTEAGSTSTSVAAAEQNQQPPQWQPEVDQHAGPFWDPSLVPSTSVPAQYPTPIVQGNSRTEYFCACPFHSEPSGLHRNHFDGSCFQYDPLSMPLPQQDTSTNGHPTSYNYDPTQFPTGLNAAFDTPMQTEPQGSSLSLVNQSNTFYDMSFTADTDENPAIEPSTEHVPSDGQPFSQVPLGSHPSPSEGTANEGMVDDEVPGPTIVQENPESPTAGSTPSSPRVASQEPGSQLDLEGPRSATSYYRTPAEKAKKPSPSRHVIREGPPPRLSSTLSATADPSVLAYACGHPDCWSDGAPSSSARYATSKELSDHNKAQHAADLGGSTPFRCGLAGCKKSWKSINGLQYHLQVSKAHFAQALAANRRTGPAEGDTSTPASVSSDESRPKPRKTFPCPHPGCHSQYKQLSGLRYHVAHGHPAELPVQLDTVPPSLARKVAEKMQRRDPSAAG